MSHFFREALDIFVNHELDGNWAELSRRAGVPTSTLQSVKGGTDPRGTTILRIAQAFQLSTDWLLTGEGSMHRSPASSPALPPDEEALLAAYRGADEAGRAALLVVAKTLARQG